MRRAIRGIIAALAVIAGLIAAGTPGWAEEAATKKAAATAPARATLEQATKTQCAAILDDVQKDGDFDAGAKRALALFDRVITQGTDRQLDAFREASYTLRLIIEVGQTPQDGRQELLKYLRAHDELARMLVFVMGAGNRPADVFKLLNTLRAARGEQVEKYAALTTAICVVHDCPLVRQINENEATAPDPVDIFDYYVKNENAMEFGIKAVPPELLIYVVDTTASIEDMKWALAKYARDPMVGSRFFDITYDFDALRKGTPKKVTEMGFTLPNILKYGGVCADQAYFAMSVGKAIGVPTAYASAESGETGHAWVGFLQAAGGKGWWNFDVGRYQEYKGIKGNVMDPQTKRLVPDSYVSLLAELIGTRAVDRQNCVALTDAALRLASMDAPEAGEGEGKATGTGGSWDVEITNARAAPRKADSEGELELLEAALNQNRAYPRAWFAVRELAKEGKLSPAQKKRWSDVLLRLCGAKYPDFAMAVLTPMIQTMDDTTEENALWNAAFNLFQKRADLSAEIRMGQARMWEAKGETAKAGQCYMDVIERYANAGPFVISALAGAEKLLADKPDKVLMLYEQTWSRIKKPEQMADEFMQQSNWFRVGMLYAGKLQEAGDTKKAESVEGQLGVTAAAK